MTVADTMKVRTIPQPGEASHTSQYLATFRIVLAELRRINDGDAFVPPAVDIEIIRIADHRAAALVREQYTA